MKSASKVTYKLPFELVGESDERSPLSTRVKKDTKTILTKAAKTQNKKVGALAAAILDDYAKWLSHQKN